MKLKLRLSLAIMPFCYPKPYDGCISFDMNSGCQRSKTVNDWWKENIIKEGQSGILTLYLFVETKGRKIISWMKKIRPRRHETKKIIIMVRVTALHWWPKKKGEGGCNKVKRIKYANLIKIKTRKSFLRINLGAKLHRTPENFIFGWIHQSVHHNLA